MEGNFFGRNNQVISLSGQNSSVSSSSSSSQQQQQQQQNNSDNSILPGLPDTADEGNSPFSLSLPPHMDPVISPSLLSANNSCATPLGSSLIQSSIESSSVSDVDEGKNPMNLSLFGASQQPKKFPSQLSSGVASFSTPNLVQLSEAEMAIAMQPIPTTTAAATTTTAATSQLATESTVSEEGKKAEKVNNEGGSAAIPIPASAIPPSFTRSQRGECLSSSLGSQPGPLMRSHNPSASICSADLVGSATATPGRTWKAGTRSAFRKTTAIFGSGMASPAFGSPRPTSVSNAVTPRSGLVAECVASTTTPTTPIAPTTPTATSSTGTSESKLDPITQRCVDEGKIIMDDDQTEIKYATIDVLIERMTTESLADSLFLQQFILTYPLHTSSDKLLDLIIARYHIPTPPNLTPAELEAHKLMVKSVQLRIIVFLQTWLKRIWNSSTPPELTEKLTAFVDEIAQGPHKNSAERIKKLISRAVTGEEKKVEYTFNGKYPAPLLPLRMLQGFPHPTVSVRTVHPIELARQMTLVERDLFGALQSWEFQDLRFAKKDKSLAPNVNAITQQFNRVSRWFAEEILMVEDLSERIKTAELCIEVAIQCEQLKNYNAVNEIVSAFSSSAVHRLHRTWKGLSPRYADKLAELTDLMSNKNNFQALRTLLHSIDPPFIPFLGVYLTDLTFIEEGNPTMRGDLINWKKCKLQARVLNEIETYKKTPYFLKEVPWICEFFKTVEVKETDDDMWNQSIKIEPRTPSTQGAESSSDGNEQTQATEPKKHAIVLPPGLPQFMGIQMNSTQTVADIKKAVLDLALRKRYLLDNPLSGISLNPDDYVIIAPANRTFPGILIRDLSVMSEMDFEGKGISGFAMIRTQQVIFVDYTLGPEAYFIMAFLDMSSPLYANEVLIDIIYKWQEEFCLMRYCPNDGNLFWLDPNFSLVQQQFDQSDHIVVIPKSLMMRPDPEDRAKMRMNTLSKMSDCKYGYLTKCNVKQLLRTGVYLRSTNVNKPVIASSASTRSLQKPFSSGEKGRRFFVVIDNFLYWYNDMQSTTPKDVWNLSYCEVSYGTLVTGALCVVVRMHLLFPFPKYRPKKWLVLTANSESVVRQWFAALSSRAHYNESTMVFSKSIKELVSRQKNSLIPDFVRYACTTVQIRAITVPTLFSYPVSRDVIEKLRTEINRGYLPRPGDSVDEFAVAQLLLSFFAEMPEPLLTNDLFSEFYSYHRSQSAVKLNSDDPDAKKDSLDKLKQIIAKLPVENAVTIYYLIKFLHLWEDTTGEKKVVLPLLQQIMMRPTESQSLGRSSLDALSIANDVVETITRQIYTMVDELDFPVDAQASETYERPKVAYNPTLMPVTCFSQEVIREITDSVVNEKPLADLDISAPAKHAIIPRTKGSGNAEGSSTGRSTSDGDSSVSGNTADSAEDSSSHHNFLSYFHRKKKDNSQSARVAPISTSSHSSDAGSSAVTPTSPALPDVNAGAQSTSAAVPPPSAADSSQSSTGLTPVSAFGSFPFMDPSGSILSPIGNIPMMGVSRVEDDEVFLDKNELDDFVADVSSNPPDSPLPFASVPPMPMSRPSDSESSSPSSAPAPAAAETTLKR